MKENFELYKADSYSEEDILQKTQFFAKMSTRRSVRDFSDQAVPIAVIRDIIMTASSAPSGANKQPWTFCAISNPQLKQQIRKAAEKEEYLNYTERMSNEWLKDLEKFDTNWQKPFLTIAPWLIVVFRKPYDIVDGNQQKNYYVQESVGIATGFLITAIHMSGLVTLTHTPSPMNFLSEILQRPAEEKAFLLLPVGYPAKNALVPILEKKDESEVLFFYT